MDSNKLYNALLKTQEKQRAEKRRESLGDERSEQDFEQAEPFVENMEPDWILKEDSKLRTPSVYDASVTLDLINNPHPWTRDQLRERKIIYPGMEEKAILDAYREIRIKLRGQSREANLCVLVSSLADGEQSTLTAFNLAATFAMDAQTSALLVDCNAHHSDLAELVSEPMEYGVTDFLADRHLSVRNILYPSGIDRLSVIPAGRQAMSAVELFSSTRMSTLMEELRGRYPDRTIIINAPPMRMSTEARILVRYAGQALLSVPFGEITPEQIMDYVDALGSEKFSGLIYQE